MRLRLASILAVSFLFRLSLANAQYVEIYKLDNLMKEYPDSQVISSLSSELRVPADMLKQEKAEYNVTFGQLYLAHQFATISKSDVKSVMAEAKAKSWGAIAKDRNIDMDVVRDEAKKLEKTLRQSPKK